LLYNVVLFSVHCDAAGVVTAVVVVVNTGVDDDDESSKVLSGNVLLKDIFVPVVGTLIVFTVTVGKLGVGVVVTKWVEVALVSTVVAVNVPVLFIAVVETLAVVTRPEWIGVVLVVTAALSVVSVGVPDADLVVAALTVGLWGTWVEGSVIGDVLTVDDGIVLQ
jgi:hypothetical protein